MSSKTKAWAIFSSIQLIGGILAFVGAQFNVLIQVLGLVVLLPGSVIAAPLPYHSLWRPFLWTRYQTDQEGLATILYLPAVLVINVLVFLALRYLYPKRDKNSASATSS
jgi:hypothetical protein